MLYPRLTIDSRSVVQYTLVLSAVSLDSSGKAARCGEKYGMRSLLSRISISVEGVVSIRSAMLRRASASVKSLLGEVRGTGAIGLHFDAGIFCLKHVGDITMRSEARVPD